MDSSQFLKLIALGVRDIQRKLDELGRLEAIVVSETPPPAAVELLDDRGYALLEESDEQDFRDRIEDVRLWCTHVSHTLGQYVHPSLGRMFWVEADGRLQRCSPLDFSQTVRWLRKALLQIIVDSNEYAHRLALSSLAVSPHPALPPTPVRAGAANQTDSLRVVTGGAMLDEFGLISPPDAQASVFVIHGHDSAGVNELVELLSDRYLVRTVVMRARTLPTVTLPEKFEACAKECNLAIALLTPDDMGARMGDDSHEARVRQNVLVELGWFWGRCGRHNVLLISRGTIDLPSDLAGLQPVRYNDTLNEVTLDVDAFMQFHKVRCREA